MNKNNYKETKYIKYPLPVWSVFEKSSVMSDPVKISAGNRKT